MQKLRDDIEFSVTLYGCAIIKDGKVLTPKEIKNLSSLAGVYLYNVDRRVPLKELVAEMELVDQYKNKSHEII